MNQNDLMRFLMANGLNPQSGALAQPQQPGILAKATQALNEPLPMEGRLTFLPARVTPQGREVALPGILASAWNAFTAPGRAYSGNMADPVGEAMNFAGMMSLGAMPSPAVGPGSVGMFAGVGAKTANKAALSKAEQMAKAGAPREQIWKETGWFNGPEGKWKFEIPDNAAAFKDTGFQSLPSGTLSSTGTRLDKVLGHDELYAAYPGARKIDPAIMVGGDLGKGQGSWGGGLLEARAGTKEAAKSVSLHELQHAIQQVEGFQTGGSSAMAFTHPKAFEILRGIKEKILSPMSVEDYAKQAWQSNKVTPEILADYTKNYLPSTKNITPQLDRAAQETAAKEAYKRLAGEAEARAVESRMNMTPAQRQATPPWQSYDMPWESLILK